MSARASLLPLLAAALVGCGPDEDPGLTERLEALEAGLEDANTEIARLQTDLATKEAALQQQIADEAALRQLGDTEVSGELGGYATTDALDALSDRVTALEADTVRVLAEDTTWELPDEVTLEAALAELDRYHVAAGATLTLALTGGSYVLDAPLTFHHPGGGRIRVEGDLANPAAVELSFTGTNGVVVDEGSALGFLGGLTLVGDGTTGHGLLVHQASTATIGPMVIRGFGDNGIAATGASYVAADTTYASATGWLVVEDSGQSGIHAAGGSVIEAPYAQVSGSLVHGFFAEQSSYLYAPYGEASANGGNGFLADEAAGVYAPDAVSSDNGLAGVNSNQGSFVYAIRATAANNEVYGFAASNNAGLQARDAHATGNQYGYFASHASFMYAYQAVATDSSDSGVWAHGQSFIQAANSTVTGDGNCYWQERHAFITADNAAPCARNYSSDNDTSDFMWGLSAL